MVLLHAARVFLTGGLGGPRRFNWLIGTGLLLGILASSFTGYLLPWDQLSYWAVTIATGMLEYVPLVGATLRRVARGGEEIGGATLVIFYTLHTIVAAGRRWRLLAAWHFWRVRRAGGVIVPPAAAGDEDRDAGQGALPAAPPRPRGGAGPGGDGGGRAAGRRCFGAPLGEPANPGMSPNPAKAPWYFVGFQELLIHLHPVFAVLVVPLLVRAGPGVAALGGRA